MQQVIYRIPWHTATFPDGIPIYGFGLMLFIAFILCTWMTGLRAKKMILSGLGLGRYLGGPNAGDSYPAGGKPNEQVETAKALIQDLAIWLFIAGLLGARLTYMYSEPQHFGNFWERLIDITNGGIILYGSVVGGLIGYGAFSLYFYWRRQAVLYTLRIADMVAPAVAVGIGLGRIGCLLNGCCYGQVACADCTAVPAIHFPLSAPPRWALVKDGYQTAAGFTFDDHQTFDRGVKVGAVDGASPAYQAGLHPGMVITAVNGKPLDGDSPREQLSRAMFDEWKRGDKDLVLTVEEGDKRLDFRPRTLGLLPTQLFETVSMALLTLLLLAYFPYRRRDGQVIALLMMCYAVHRTLNEMLRGDIRPVGFEAYSSYLLFAAGALLMVWVLRKPVEYKSEWELAT